MELRSDVKPTAVGIVPREWDICELREACRETITYGIVQCGPHVKNGVPYIRVSDMDEPELDVERMLRTSPSIAARFERSTVKEGDLVYALRGKIGEVRQVRAALAGANLTQGTARLSPSEKVDTGYFVWAMRNPRSLRQAELQAKGTTFREITLADLRRILILVPPLPEQRAIAGTLSDVDALLGALDRLIAKKRDLKQAAMQQLLTGQNRLPGFSGEWEVLPFKDVFNISAGGDVNPTLSSSERDQMHCYPIYSNSVADHGFYGYCSYADHPANSVTITARGTLGVANYRDHKYTAVGRVLVLEPKREAAGKYFEEFINSRITFAIESTGVPQLTAPQIGGYLLAVPTLPEQTAIAAVLTDMDAELAVLQQRLAKTRALKQGMMQELLTGKTRLVPSEVASA